VAATDRAAEQAILPAVVNRKVNGATARGAGAQVQGVLLSVSETRSRQARSTWNRSAKPSVRPAISSCLDPFCSRPAKQVQFQDG